MILLPFYGNRLRSIPHGADPQMEVLLTHFLNCEPDISLIGKRYEEMDPEVQELLHCNEDLITESDFDLRDVFYIQSV